MNETVDPGRIEAVIFDFAGVLTTSPRALMAARAASVGRPFEELMPVMLGPLDEDTDHPWHRTERGEMSLAEFVAESRATMDELGLPGTFEPPSPDEMLAGLQAIPEMLATAEATRRNGRRTAILSNNIREWAAWRSVVDADALVDEVVDSCEVGMRKPAAEIFELTADRLGVDPTSCLMVDDFEWNVRGARRAGLQAFHVSEPAADSAKLRRLLAV